MREAHVHLNVSEHDFDVVALEIDATLSYLGAPEKEHKEFMDLIESYRSMVVTQPAWLRAMTGTTSPSPTPAAAERSMAAARPA